MQKTFERDWLQPQPLGAGSVYIKEEPSGTWAIILDGTYRAFARSRALAEHRAQLLYEALRPERSCPCCGRYVGVNSQGRVPGHHQPKMAFEAGRPCPGAGVKLPEEG